MAGKIASRPYREHLRQVHQPSYAIYLYVGSYVYMGESLKRKLMFVAGRSCINVWWTNTSANGQPKYSMPARGF